VDVAALSRQLQEAAAINEVADARAAAAEARAAAADARAAAEGRRADAADAQAVLRPQAEAATSVAHACDADTTSVTGTIIADMNLSSNVALQRLRTGLGDLLKSPLPLSTLDARPGATPILADEFLPYEGSYDEYALALRKVTTGREQKRHVVAVAQASGSGKTRLAYALGMSRALVVVVHIAKQGTQAFTPAWQTFLDVARNWAAVRPRLQAEARREVSRYAMAALRLLVGCYVEWVADVVGHVLRSNFEGAAPTTESAPSAQQIRVAALRCLRNSRGDSAVGKRYAAQLQALSSRVSRQSLDGCGQVEVTAVDCEAANRKCAELDVRLRALLWSDADVVVSFDEVQQLFGTPRVFMTLNDYSGNGAADAQGEDCFYGLTALMPLLADEQRWAQSMCGSWLAISTTVKLPNMSPLHKRVTTLHHASRITATDMWHSLSSFLQLGDMDCEYASELKNLTGRPVFFFYMAWGALWAVLSSSWGAASPPSVDAACLRTLVLSALRNAVKEARDWCNERVGSLWDEPVVLPSGVSTRTLCLELYAAARMHGGDVSIDNTDAISQAVQYGMLALPVPADEVEGGGSGGAAGGASRNEATATPATTSAHISLCSEPLMFYAICAKGDAQVRRLRGAPENDPIFSLLASWMRLGQVAGFALTTSIKGNVFELAFAWHVVRTVLCSNRGMAELSDVLAPLAAAGWAMPEAVNGMYVVATKALPRDLLPSSRATDFDFLDTIDAASAVVIDLDLMAGADLAFCAVDEKRTPKAAVLVQCKGEKAAQLLECLRASTPAWQYTTKPDRDSVLQGKRVGWTDKRNAFSALVALEDRASSARRSA
jgi:hypothetical protein